VIDVDVEPWSATSGEVYAFDDEWDDIYLAAVYGTGNKVADYLNEQGFRLLALHLPPRKRVGYISGMEVSEPARGRGIGSEMLTRALTALHDLGVREVYLHAQPEHGHLDDLLRFYERHGFTYIFDELYPVMVRKLR
jgi:GNAT superfamily N-acetyltransferase